MPARLVDQATNKHIQQRRVRTDQPEIKTALAPKLGYGINVVWHLRARAPQREFVLAFIHDADGAIGQILPLFRVEFLPAEFGRFCRFYLKSVVIDWPIFFYLLGTDIFQGQQRFPCAIGTSS